MKSSLKFKDCFGSLGLAVFVFGLIVLAFALLSLRSKTAVGPSGSPSSLREEAIRAAVESERGDYYFQTARPPAPFSQEN